MPFECCGRRLQSFPHHQHGTTGLHSHFIAVINLPVVIINCHPMNISSPHGQVSTLFPDLSVCSSHLFFFQTQHPYKSSVPWFPLGRKPKYMSHTGDRSTPVMYTDLLSLSVPPFFCIMIYNKWGIGLQKKGRNRSFCFWQDEVSFLPKRRKRPYTGGCHTVPKVSTQTLALTPSFVRVSLHQHDYSI